MEPKSKTKSGTPTLYYMCITHIHTIVMQNTKLDNKKKRKKQKRKMQFPKE